MSGTDPFDDVASGRESVRAALALVCILAVVIAAAALPTLSLPGVAGQLGSNASADANVTGALPTPGNGTMPGDGRRAPGNQSVPLGQGAGATPTGTAGQPPGGTAGSGDGQRGSQTGSGETGGQSDGGATGNQTGSGETGSGTSDGTSGGTGDGTSDGTGDGTSGDGTSDGTSDGSTGDGTSGDGTSDGTSDGSTGDGTGGDATGTQTGDGDATGSGTSDDGTGDGTSDGETTDGTSGDGTSDGETTDGTSGDGTSDGETTDGTSDSGTETGTTGGDTSSQTSGDGTSGDGTDDGTSGDGTDDGTSSDGTDDGTSSDGTDDGTSSDGTDDGTSSDGTDDGTTGDETSSQTSDTTDGDGTQTDGDGTDQSDGDTVDDQSDAAPSYNVSLNRSATAGAVVEVTVTRGGEPAAGVGVSFNGAAVGTTDAAGAVVGRVPYDDRLNITLDAGAQQSLSTPPRPRGDRLFALAGPVARQTNESFVVNTNVSLSISGPVVTGGNVTLTATIDDVPVRSAAVTVDGERVGTTNDSGRLELRLPAEPGNYTVAVSRDAVTGERTVTLDGLSVETGPSLPLALPGTGLDVRVTAGGEPVPNATVVLDGAAVAETDGNGTARLTLPFAGSATVTVRQYGQVRETVVGGLYINLAGVLVGALALVSGAGYLLRRRGVSRASVAGWLRTATQLAVNALLWLAAALDGALGRLRTRIALTVAALRVLVARRRTPAQLWAALRAWAVARIEAFRASADAAATAARNADPRDTDTGTVDDRTTIRAAWGRFVERVSLGRSGTATPGEIAAHAVEEDDIPAEAVETLREAYRAVEYGQYDPGDHVAAAERALETIEHSAEGADDETGGDAA